MPKALVNPAADSTVASQALASIRAWPVRPVRRVMGWLIRGKVTHWVEPREEEAPGDAYRAPDVHGAEPHLADPAISAQAEALGLRYVGVAEERALLGRLRKDVWLDPERTIQLHSRLRQTRDHAPLSVYHLSTYFQDGSCVITWNHPPRTPSDDNLDSRAGSGWLTRDIEDHRAAVARWGQLRGTHPLLVDGPDAVAGLMDHYYRHVVPRSMATSYLRGLVLMAALACLAIEVIFLVWRRLQ